MSLEYHKEEFGHWTSDEDDDYDEDEEIGNNGLYIVFDCIYIVHYL